MSLPMGGPFQDDNPVSADNSFAINSKIMIVAVVVLFGVVMFILGLHIYAKWFWRHGGQNGGSIGGWRRRRRLEFAADLQGHQRTSTHVGLDKSVLDQLPTFAFDEEKASVNNEGALECAVCLEEFADGEKGRLLPKCNHSFHIDCIDMWFHSHSTCPLCRCSVGPESSSSTAVTIVVQQPSDGSQNDDGVGARPSPSGAVLFTISDGVALVGRQSDYRQEGTQTSSGAATVVAVVEHGAEFYSPADSAAGAGAGLPSPRQQQNGSRPESPSSRRPSTGLSPKPSGIQYPANVLFWGNQTQMNAAGAGHGTGAGPREDNSSRRRFSSGVHAPSSLVIEIPRALPLDSSSTVGPAPHHNNTNSSDEAHRASDAQAGAGGGGGPKSPIGRLVSSSFRRLLSIRRGATSPGPEATCSSFDCEQQQPPQGSAISSSAGTTSVVQGSRQG